MSTTYVKANLKPNENILGVGQLHWIIYINKYIVCGILIILSTLWLSTTISMGYNNVLLNLYNSPLTIMLLLGVFLVFCGIIVVIIEKITTEYVITNIKVIKKVGWIRREVHEINISKIETVNINQSILGRLLGYGTVIVSGTGTQFISIKDIYTPLTFKLHIPNNS